MPLPADSEEIERAYSNRRNGNWKVVKQWGIPSSKDEEPVLFKRI